MIKELERVVLSADLPDEGLKAGDVGTVVMIHQGGKGFEVEFVTLDGETIAVTSVGADQSAPRQQARDRSRSTSRTPACRIAQAPLLTKGGWPVGRDGSLVSIDFH